MLTALVLAATATTLRLDLDGDGRPDTVTLAQNRASVTISVRFSDSSHPAQRFTFPVDASREDAVCAVPVHLSEERLPPKRKLAFAVVDERCDSIHFFWDERDRRLEWWRE